MMKVVTSTDGKVSLLHIAVGDTLRVRSTAFGQSFDQDFFPETLTVSLTDDVRGFPEGIKQVYAFRFIEDAYVSVFRYDESGAAMAVLSIRTACWTPQFGVTPRFGELLSSPEADSVVRFLDHALMPRASCASPIWLPVFGNELILQSKIGNEYEGQYYCLSQRAYKFYLEKLARLKF